MFCRGWIGPCGSTPIARVHIEYEGARKFPSEWDMCARCAKMMVDWVDTLRATYDVEPLVFEARVYVHARS